MLSARKHPGRCMRSFAIPQDDKKEWDAQVEKRGDV
jgi:hypothetical protein